MASPLINEARGTGRMKRPELHTYSYTHFLILAQ